MRVPDPTAVGLLLGKVDLESMMTPSGGYKPLCLVVSCAWAMVARESCGGCARGVTEAVAMREMMTTTITIWMLSEAAVF